MENADKGNRKIPKKVNKKVLNKKLRIRKF